MGASTIHPHGAERLAYRSRRRLSCEGAVLSSAAKNGLGGGRCIDTADVAPLCGHARIHLRVDRAVPGCGIISVVSPKEALVPGTVTMTLQSKPELGTTRSSTYEQDYLQGAKLGSDNADVYYYSYFPTRIKTENTARSDEDVALQMTHKQQITLLP